MGHRVSHAVVAKILGSRGYSLQGTRKTLEGRHPDRDAQFRYINGLAEQFLASGDPVINVDTKKKELAGRYAQDRKEWQPEGEPVEVSTYDFPVDHDTSVFTVATIEQWWHTMGKHKYPNTWRILIAADGGSNGHRNWLWKLELTRLAAAIGIDIVVCHYPPGTSKWNKIEHRLFSRITYNWRGRPLETYQTIVNLIANTTTMTGLTVHCELDSSLSPARIKLSQQHKLTSLARHEFHGDWNYTIRSANLGSREATEPASRAVWDPVSGRSSW